MSNDIFQYDYVSNKMIKKMETSPDTEADITTSRFEDSEDEIHYHDTEAFGAASSTKETNVKAEEYAPLVLVNDLRKEFVQLKSDLDNSTVAQDREELGKDTFSFFALASYPDPLSCLRMFWNKSSHGSAQENNKNNDDLYPEGTDEEDSAALPTNDKLNLPFWWAFLVLFTQHFIYWVVLTGSTAWFMNDLPLGVTLTIRLAQVSVSVPNDKSYSQRN